MAQVVADMAGTVYQVLVVEGDQVFDGQDVVVLESMKMEVPVSSTSAGRVAAIHVQPGDFVNEGDVLLEVE
ncbi:acetyl-CoA carboxylase biotin carboxyl carrier protein subunit [Alicyclobacillus fastidiosus]|uniref:Acetyl-CoA carboxylase biotin carboxyl carrier protein subunit n=1 Tax=Alicyclobacillus fastidiosus TaxID=392011 RepID=A0ABY6ZM42_9BACL|nr:acetyl-CoA carboxylase biotin carboxyl carrier protein subunit [Alicyclobacillus fastidiosus]WAH43902.1 acetyl-CoA carboxylase biotin carboxyl carrier protein subunit [Alicyclobacillus fastidiosus]GMA60146.1 acetyl-CoA carboxylase biotin carboxyl carrier protein subunit [Alicyclobacillus fastidiosus]